MLGFVVVYSLLDLFLVGLWMLLYVVFGVVLTGYYNVGLGVGRYVCVCYCVCFWVGVYVVGLGLLRAG